MGRTEFFAITHIDSDDTRKDFSGVLGFGRPQTEKVYLPTYNLVQELYDRNLIKSPEFSLYACLVSEGTPSITLGGTNSAYVKPDAVTTN